MASSTRMQPLAKIWMNGRFVPFRQARVHVLTHALHYGTAIFEGIRCYATPQGPAVFRLRDHLARLYRGAKVYGIRIPYTIEKLERATLRLIKVNKTDRAYIRPIVYMGYKEIGLSMDRAPVDVAVIAVRFDRYFSSAQQRRGLRCRISTWTRQLQQALSPHVKASANYLNSTLAKMEAEREGYDEAIMLNHEGHVSEGTGENIFIARKGKLITPPFYDDILGGVTRESVIEMARDMELVVEEKSILRDELYTADEVFLTGTAAEILHVQSVDKIRIGNGKAGPITRALQEKFRRVVRGEDVRYRKWLTPVR